MDEDMYDDLYGDFMEVNKKEETIEQAQQVQSTQAQDLNAKSQNQEQDQFQNQIQGQNQVEQVQGDPDEFDDLYGDLGQVDNETQPQLMPKEDTQPVIKAPTDQFDELLNDTEVVDAPLVIKQEKQQIEDQDQLTQTNLQNSIYQTQQQYQTSQDQSHVPQIQLQTDQQVQPKELQQAPDTVFEQGNDNQHTLNQENNSFFDLYGDLESNQNQLNGQFNQAIQYGNGPQGELNQTQQIKSYNSQEIRDQLQNYYNSNSQNQEKTGLPQDDDVIFKALYEDEKVSALTGSETLAQLPQEQQLQIQQAQQQQQLEQQQYQQQSSLKNINQQIGRIPTLKPQIKRQQTQESSQTEEDDFEMILDTDEIQKDLPQGQSMFKIRHKPTYQNRVLQQLPDPPKLQKALQQGRFPKFPMQAQQGDPILLPGQHRVAMEEYQEFLALGHGNIFNVDIDMVVNAPWRFQNQNLEQFFNFGLNEQTWKSYQSEVQKYRALFNLKQPLPILETQPQNVVDSDLPPEVQQSFINLFGKNVIFQPSNQRPQIFTDGEFGDIKVKLGRQITKPSNDVEMTQDDDNLVLHQGDEYDHNYITYPEDYPSQLSSRQLKLFQDQEKQRVQQEHYQRLFLKQASHRSSDQLNFRAGFKYGDGFLGDDNDVYDYKNQEMDNFQLINRLSQVIGKQPKAQSQIEEQDLSFLHPRKNKLKVLPKFLQKDFSQLDDLFQIDRKRQKLNGRNQSINRSEAFSQLQESQKLDQTQQTQNQSKEAIQQQDNQQQQNKNTELHYIQQQQQLVDTKQKQSQVVQKDNLLRRQTQVYSQNYFLYDGVQNRIKPYLEQTQKVESEKDSKLPKNKKQQSTFTRLLIQNKLGIKDQRDEQDQSQTFPSGYGYKLPPNQRSDLQRKAEKGHDHEEYDKFAPKVM